MEILLIFLGIAVVIIIIVMIKYYTDPKLRKAVKILNEEHDKKPFEEASKVDVDIIINDEYEDYIASDDLENIMLDLTEYDDLDESIELPIKGINFRGLTTDHVGTFDGFIVPDKGNGYDEYAIAIYNSNGVHFGFVEKGQKALYDKVMENDGTISCKLEVVTFIDDDNNEKLYGHIEINKKDLL